MLTKTARCRTIMINNTFFGYSYMFYEITREKKKTHLDAYAQREKSVVCRYGLEVWEWSTNVFRDWKSATNINIRNGEKKRKLQKNKEITTKKWASKRKKTHHRNNYLPHNFITYDAICNVFFVAAFISFKKSRHRLHTDFQNCSTCWRIIFFVSHTIFYVVSARTVCTNHARIGIFRILNNYRLTDSIIQTTWTYKIGLFLSDEHMLQREAAVDFL